MLRRRRNGIRAGAGLYPGLEKYNEQRGSCHFSCSTCRRSSYSKRDPAIDRKKRDRPPGQVSVATSCRVCVRHSYQKGGVEMDKPWLRFYDEGVPATIDYPPTPLDQLLTDAATKHPDSTATIFGARVGSRVMDARQTYRQINDLTNRFAAGLQKMGVKQGDRVAIMLPNCPQFIIAAFATWRIGGIVVCCNPLYMPPEIEHLVGDSGAETFVVLSSLYERVKGIRANTKLKRIIVANIKEYFSGMLKFLFTLGKEKKEGHRVSISGDANTYWFQDILRNAPDKPTPV